ncbi:MAG TPA: site-2 protease family protein [Acidimicrobiia bacterium]
MISDNGVLDAVLFIAILLPSVIFHEVAHGVVARRLGDPTAKEAGRLTLNPIRHIDPFGSVLLPAMLALAHQNVFGWAKPVPVNPSRFRRNPIRGMAITALAGPATNLTIALVVGRFGPFVQEGDTLYLTSPALWAHVMSGVLVVNAALAVFNMLPIPPLDGSRLLPLVLPPAGRRVYAQMSQYGFIILFVLVLVIPRSLAFLGTFIDWIVRVAV